MAVAVLLTVMAAIMSPVVEAQTHLTYTIMEEPRPGSLIADVVEGAMLASEYSPQVLDSLQFRFLTLPTTNLTLDTKSGLITTSGRLDRDVICPQSEKCELSLDIAISPVQYFRTIKISLEILDINDNAPTFPDSKLVFEVLESSSTETVAFTVAEAVDNDSPDNGVKVYELISKTGGADSAPWYLQVKEEVDGSRQVRLALAEPLDREKQAHYHLQVIAADGGMPSKSGSVDVYIEVQDANDNSPIFKQESYEVTINENTPPMTTIARLYAEDADWGPNGQVMYTLGGRSATNYGHLFGVNNSTGQVYIKGNIDYEENPSYLLTIVARDRGPGSVPTSVSLVVNVRDLNDHAPIITINTLKDTNQSSAVEDAEVGTFVAYIAVKDPDSGLNGRFNCSLRDNTFELKYMSPGVYYLVTKAVLDREQTAQYNLSMVCKDQGSPPRTSVKSIPVVVADINDNDPVFSKSEYVAEIFENNYIGAFVKRVNATDKDQGQNAEIVYSLGPSDLAFFEIDAVTGIIKARASLDREVRDEYNLVVMAQDRGTPQARNASAILKVKVMDANDQQPLFVPSTYSLGVPENQEAGTNVGYLSAHDADSYPNNQHYFVLLPRGSLSDAFEVDKNTGEIRTTRPLDREQQSTYELIAVAKDSNSAMLSSTATVSIHVVDVNDNPPRFIFPNIANNTVQISHKVVLGYIIAKVTAEDEDVGGNGKVFYNISRGNEEGIFSIDPKYGTISVNVDLSDKPDNKTWTLHVMASDQGQEVALSATSFLHVVINHGLSAFGTEEGENTMLSGTNFIIVIVVGCVSGGLIVILLIVIIVLLRKQQLKRGHMHRYNCRMQALQKMAAQEMLKGTDGGSGGEIKKTKNKNGSDLKDTKQGRPELGKSGGVEETGSSLGYKSMDGGSQSTKMDLSHEKSRQWLATLDPHSYESHSDYSSTDTSKSAPVEGSTVITDCHQGQHQYKNGSGNKHWSHDNYQQFREDASSVQSGDGSNTDSGRGLSEGDLDASKLYNQGVTTTTDSALHNLHSSPRYQPPRSAPHPVTFSSFRGDDPVTRVTSVCRSPTANENRNNNHPNKSNDAVVAIKTYASSLDKFAKSHPYYRNDLNLTSPRNISNQLPNNRCKPSECDKLTKTAAHGHPGNMDRLLGDHSNTSTLNRAGSQMTDDDAATTTSGSYVVDPHDLSDDLDPQSFFQGMVV